MTSNNSLMRLRRELLSPLFYLGITAASFAASPTLTGIPNGRLDVDDDFTTGAPFADAVVGDADGDTLTVTVTVDAQDEGSLTNASGSGFVETSTAGEYTYTGSVANAQAKLRGLRFVPAENTLEVDDTEDTVISVSVDDNQGNNDAAEDSRTVRVTSVNDSPVIGGVVVSNLEVDDDDATGAPFSGVTITDVDTGEVVTVTVTVNADDEGSLVNSSGSGFTETATDGEYTYSGSVANATTKLQGLRFVPAENTIPVGDTENTVLTINVDDGDDSASASRTVEVTSINDSPAISGISGSNLQVNDNDTTKTPFSGVSITDPDADEQVTVTVTIDAAAEGSFSNLDGFVNSNPGEYTFTGTVTNATSKLAALRFVPAENTITVGDRENSTLTVSVSDGEAAPVQSSRVARVTSINDVPSVTLGSQVAMDDNEVKKIFAASTIVDPDHNEQLVVTVTFDESKGSFPASAGTFSGSTSSRTLTFSSMSSSAAQTALQNLEFTPVPNLELSNEFYNLTFRVEATDVQDVNDPDDDRLTVRVKSINDVPNISPSTLSAIEVFGGSATTVFQTLNLVDPDSEGNTGDSVPNPNKIFTATITLDNASLGTIVSTFFTGSGTTYTFNGTRDQVESAIKQAQFSANYTATTAGTPLELSVTVEDATDTSNEVTLDVTIKVPNPAISGLVSGQQISDKGVIFPFASTFFSNFGSSRDVVVVIDNADHGAFDILSGFTKNGNVYTKSGNSADNTAALQNLRFKPATDRIVGESETVRFSLYIYNTGDPHGPTYTGSTNVLDVTVTSVNDAPVIQSDGPEWSVNDDDTVLPFATMVISDVDEVGEQTVHVEVSLMGQDVNTNAALAGGGTFSALTGVTAEGTYPDVVYKFSGTPEEVKSLIQALEFVPESNRNAVGQRESVSFTVRVTDEKGADAIDQATTVIVTSVNGAPKITGIPELSQQPAPIPESGSSMMVPFADLAVTDIEELDFTISLDDPTKGTLSEDAVNGFTKNGDVYEMTGTTTEITTALKALTYTISNSYDFPEGQKGLTTFTFTAVDSTNTTTEHFTLFARDKTTSHIVTSTLDSGAGSLREAIGFAGNGDHIVFDFPVDDYPITITLDSTLEIGKDISIVGSGVNDLIISGNQSVGIFNVTNAATLNVKRLTLKDGSAASYGGAIAVGEGCGLIAQFCHFTGNVAGQFGGAIDVYDGAASIEQCLFYLNSVSGSTAKGGGAVSIYTSEVSSIRNCTFINNEQQNPGGDGGGAVYIENADLAKLVDLLVEHCTFLNNVDEATSGSAILSANAGMSVQLRNTILADEQGLVLDVLGGGVFESLGGNIATDATSTTYTQSGPQNITILDHATDLLSSDPKLDVLANNFGATLTCSLLPGSPAIDNAIVVDSVVADQRGYWRNDGSPDIGAFELGVFQRLQVNEVYVDGGATEDFIEFYNPRDSAPLDMENIELYVDGELVQTFAAMALNPGNGFAWSSTVDLDPEKGTIELRNADGYPLLGVDYVASFSAQGAELDTSGQSITRYPRYDGSFLPHQRVVENITGSTGDNTSEGLDVDGSALGGGNAPPIAVVDVDEDLNPVFHVVANAAQSFDVLSNDLEFDRTDSLKITEVMPLLTGSVVNAELANLPLEDGSIDLTGLPTGIDTSLTLNGAAVTKSADGLLIEYDPTNSDALTALYEGETYTDIWAYTMVDYDSLGALNSRGTEAAKNIEKATTYFTVLVTGVNEAPEAFDDTIATTENQAIRLLADATLLANPSFDFGDNAADYGEFDAEGNEVTLKPLAPTLALLANDDDVDKDDSNLSLIINAIHPTDVPASLLEITTELGATVRLDVRNNREETSILYDPSDSPILNALSQNEMATDSFYYTVVDKHGAQAVAKVTVNVTGVNDVPTASDDSGFAAFENQQIQIAGATLLLNDVDPDQNDQGGDDDEPIILPFVNNLSQLGATISFDGTTITYDPSNIDQYKALARNESLVDTFEYTISDTKLGESTATVTIVVSGINDTPTAQADNFNVLENETLTVDSTLGLLSNDEDIDINGTTPDDNPWVIAQRDFTTPMGGLLNINTDGSFSYNANSALIESLKEGESVDEVFNYVLTDNSRTTASDDRFRLLVDSELVNLPILLNDVVAGAQWQTINSYSAANGDSSIVVIESPNHSLRDGLLVKIEGYDGDAEYNGVYPITSVDVDRFSISVPYLDAPALALGSWIPWVSITNVSATSMGGELTVTEGQSVVYTPTPGFYGAEEFTYTIEDGAGGQDVATVSLVVIKPQFNGLVTLNNDRFKVGMGEAAVEVDVLANDAMLPWNNEDFVIEAVEALNGATGTVDITNGGKSLTYTPSDLGTELVESFTYSVNTGGGDLAQAVVTFQVIDRSDLLHGNDDDFYVVLGSSDNLLDVLANDSNLPIDSVEAALTTVNGSALTSVTPSAGSVSIVDNKISYTPPVALLTDTFKYTAKDASGATVEKEVNVRVVSSSQDFYASNDHFTVLAGSDTVQLPVLLNDGAVMDNGAVLEVVNLGLDLESPDDAERVSINGGTTINYTPSANAGSESFNYEIGIGTVERREAIITVTVVDSLSGLPSPEDDYFSVAKNSGTHTLDVLLNDIPYPAAGWKWTVKEATAHNGGTVVVVDNGTALTYTSAEDFFGTETVTYTVVDSIGNEATATLTVQVGGMIANDDQFAVLQGTSDNPLDVLANDDLLGLYSESYTISNIGVPSSNGVFTIAGSGPNNSILYSPEASFSGTETVTYELVDQTGNVLQASLSVDVLGVNSDRSTADLTITLTGVNDIPLVTNVTNSTTTDKESIRPFSSVVISDLDESGNQSQHVTVSFDSYYGSAQSAAMTQTAPGSFEITGTPAEVTAALNAFEFIPRENLIGYVDPGFKDLDLTLTVTDNYINSPLSNVAVLTIMPVNDAPEPVGDIVNTEENQAVRILVDSALLAPVDFDFGDLGADYMDYDATGAEVTLLPKLPTVALLANDGDVDIDDTNLTLKVVAIHTDNVPANLLQITSELGAQVRLDFRANREETSIVYDPRGSAILNALSSDEVITDSFYYSVVDSHGAYGIAKVSVNVTGVNDVPTATDDSGFTTNENEPLDILDTVLLLNDVDPDQNDSDLEDAPVITLPPVSQSQLGAVVRFDGTTVTYDPSSIAQYEALARNESIIDTFTYTISDANFGESSATVSIVVTGVNDTPTTQGDYMSVNENDTLVVGSGLGVLSNDEDVDINGTTPDDDPWVIARREFVTPMGALLNIHTDGSFTYDANSALIESLKEDERVEEVFSYVMTDNSRTTASDDSFKLAADSALVNLPVLINDAVVGAEWQSILSYSADDENASVVVIESPNHSLRDGLLVKIEGYEGDAGYNGVYPITSVGVDTFSITVPYLDDPAGFRGSWKPWLTITEVSETSMGGIVSIIDGQSFNYTPTPGFYGTEEFSYTIEDGAGGQDVASVSLMVVKPQANGFLRLSNDTFKVGMGESAVEVDVLDNDSVLPLNNSALLIESVTAVGGATGSVEITNGGRSLSYTPADLSTELVESFTYTVTAGGDITSQATVTFQVIDRSEKLNGNDDRYFVVLGSSNNLLDVLANDPSLPTYPVDSTLVSVNGSALTSVTPLGGSVSIVGNQVSYTPPGDVVTDTFTYTARDASGASVVKEVNVRVVPAEQNFYASGDHYTVLAGSGTLRLPVLLNDGVVMDNGAVIEIVNLGLDSESPSDVDRVSIASGVAIDYTAPAVAGTESFNYEISVGTTERREATITITVVDSFLDQPLPVNDFYSVAKNSGPHTFNVLLNDIPLPAAGWEWSVSSVSAAQGTVSVTEGGAAVSYAPAEGFFGIETFTYTIVDSFGDTATASITVQVGELNASDDQFAVLEGSVENELNILVNDDLLGFYAGDYTISTLGTPSSNGTFSISGVGPNNTILYTPEPGFIGEETVSYEVVDQTGNVLQANVTVNVLAMSSDRSSSDLTIELIGVNDIPQIAGIEDGETTDKLSIRPFSSLAISDLDESGNQIQTVSVSFDSFYGSASAAMTQTSEGRFEMTGTPAAVTAALVAFEFTPHENVIDYIDPSFADVDFTLTVTDGYISSPIVEVATITVTPVNDAPTVTSPFADLVVHTNAFARGLYLAPHFADVDDEVYGDEIVWTIAGNSNPALFSSVTVDPASKLVVIEFAADQTGVSNIIVKATDRGGLEVTTAFNVIVEGPPVIQLGEGQTSPPVATIVPGSESEFLTDYVQSFRVSNDGTLPVESFIVRVSDLIQPEHGITVHQGRYSTDENGTYTNFNDDTTSAAGVTVLEKSSDLYDVKYDTPIAPGGSVVVHVIYRVGTNVPLSIRPTIEVFLSTITESGATGVSGISRESGDGIDITFNVEANKSYKLHYSSDLQMWTDWLTPIPVSDFDRQIKVIDDGYNTGSHPTTDSQRFYQLVEIVPEG